MRIDNVTENDLCISCGICAGVCPAKAIDSEYKEGMYVPKINTSKCTDCGLCGELCPGRGCDYDNLYKITGQNIPEDIFLGNDKGVHTFHAKDEEWLKNSGSGGVVTRLVHNLLADRQYDAAFLVDTYNYGKEVFTYRYTSLNSNEETAKSRYVPVNQKNAVEYIRQHKDEKIILVGTSCFI